jgi:hypothetical protein
MKNKKETKEKRSEITYIKLNNNTDYKILYNVEKTFNNKKRHYEIIIDINQIIPPKKWYTPWRKR